MTSPSLQAHPLVSDWLALDELGTVTVRSGKVEIGQRISTALALIAAAELGLAADRVRVAPVVTGQSPDEGMTSGSNSIEHSGEAVRLAAATARRHLLELAARALGVESGSLELVDALVRERGSNRSVSFWELVPGGQLQVPVDVNMEAVPGAPDAAVQELLRTRRAQALATGAVHFVHDALLPDALHARVVRPPHACARLSGLDESVIASSAGVHLVREGSFLAVAAVDEYAAVRAAARVAGAARWDVGDGLDGGDIFARLRSNERVSLAVVDGAPVDGPLPAPIDIPADAVVSLTACYERPYQMHGAIGPSAAMALFDGGVLRVWSHSQGVYPLRASLAELLHMTLEHVVIEHRPGAGCYGHNGADDAALDAALVARALPGRAVVLKWSREDEHAWEPYAPAMAVVMSGAVDAAGTVRAWSHESFSDTHSGRPRAGANGVGPARLLASRWLEHPPPPYVPAPNRSAHAGIHRNADPYYRFGERRIVKHLVRGLSLRTSAMRTLGGFANTFAIECFLDELAHGAERDPLALRLAHLDDPRARELLDWVAAEIGWQAGQDGRGAGNGRGRGIGFGRYKNRQAYVAVAVELRVDDAARVWLERAAIATDAGRVVDRDGLAAQMEGGFLQAASWTLYEQVRFDAGGVTSRDWDGYPILRFDNVPDVQVRVVDRPAEPPLGAGEAVSGPSGAAIANAVFDATGLRLRRLPLTPEALRAAALR